MHDWQPIEIAPRDGTAILVINGETSGFYTKAYQMGVATWDRQAMPGGEECWCARDCCDGVTTYIPTHWMSLPELMGLEDA